jgi:hypothetical protein
VEHIEPLAVVSDHLQLSNRDGAPATPRRVPSSPEPASQATAPDFLDRVEQHWARVAPLHLWLVAHVQADQGRPRSRG